jgi:hypothetical protein
MLLVTTTMRGVKHHQRHAGLMTPCRASHQTILERHLEMPSSPTPFPSPPPRLRLTICSTVKATHPLRLPYLSASVPAKVLITSDDPKPARYSVAISA